MIESQTQQPAGNGRVIRQTEQELRSVIDTAHEAFVSMDEDGLITYWNPQAEQTFGWTLEEAVGRVLAETIIPERYREAHRHGLRRFLASGEGTVLGTRFEIHALHRDGHEFPVELTVSAARRGGRWSFNAFLHDISERKRGEQQLELVRELALAIGSVERSDEALELAVRKICQATGLSAGQAWVLAVDGVRLVCSPSWYADGDGLEPFRKVSERVSFDQGTAFIGRAWATGEPIWLEDLPSDPECLRVAVAQEVGLGSALAIPVSTDDNVVAVLEFVVRERRARDEELLNLLRMVAAQLGSLIGRKRAEDALRRRELQLAQAQSITRTGSWEWEIAWNKVSWSAELYRIFGVDPQRFEPSYQGFLEVVHPDDREHVENEIRLALTRGSSFEFEHRVVRPDGTVRTVRCHGEVIRDKLGVPARMVGTCQDVTERKLAEEEIGLAHELALAIGEAETVEAAFDFVLSRICERTEWALGQVWTRNGSPYLELSPACHSSCDELSAFVDASRSMTLEPGIGLPGLAWARKAPVWIKDVRTDPNFPRAPFAKAAGLKAGVAVPVLARDEVMAVMEFFMFEPREEDERLITLVSSVAAQLGSLIDHKHTEEAQRKSEECFRSLVDSFDDHAICMLDSAGHVTSWNPGAERITGYSADEIVGYHISRFYKAEAVESAEPERHLELAAANGRYEESDWRVRRDGLRFWANVVITPLYGKDGQVRGFSHVARDITERKRADEELQRLGAVVEHSDDAIFSTAGDQGIIATWNRGAERLFGYSAREVIGRSIRILVPPEQPGSQPDVLEQLLEGKRVEHHETSSLKKNGSQIEISLTVSPISDQAGGVVGLSGIARDITERKRAQRALEQAFGTYLDRSVADYILEEGESLPGEEVDVTMMFVDIRDFMSYAERFEPRDVVATLNCLFELAVPIITRHGGHVDKFVGDGLLAVFGAPRRCPEHACRALLAALEIDRCAREQFQGDLEIGIGIDSGPVVAGNVGGGGRLDFTVIGNAVNVAARVESATRQTGDTILISEETARRAANCDVVLDERPGISLKGKSQPVVLYAPRESS